MQYAEFLMQGINQLINKMDKQKQQLRDILINHHKFAAEILESADDDIKLMIAIVGIQTSMATLDDYLDELQNEHNDEKLH